MTTDDIERAARAGFGAYYRTRAWWTWNTTGNAVHIRWNLVAARVLNGQITTPAELRDAYCEDIFGAPAWSVKQAGIWREVLHAIQRAGTMEAAA